MNDEWSAAGPALRHLEGAYLAAGDRGWAEPENPARVTGGVLAALAYLVQIEDDEALAEAIVSIDALGEGALRILALGCVIALRNSGWAVSVQNSQTDGSD